MMLMHEYTMCFHTCVNGIIGLKQRNLSRLIEITQQQGSGNRIEKIILMGRHAFQKHMVYHFAPLLNHSIEMQRVSFS